MSEPNPNLPNQDEIIQGHNYDGIREYDNPMPGWWIWIFWLCVIFAPFYVLGNHVFGFINSYEEDLAESQADLQAIRAAHAAENPAPAFDEATLQALAEDPGQVAAGQEVFMTNCMACHGAEGQGLIGPNLTDAYWVHGGTNEDILRIINEGVLAKGMPPWQNILAEEAKGQLVAYVRSIVGTSPANPKAPEGELIQ